MTDDIIYDRQRSPRDIGLVTAGILMILYACFFIAFPGITLYIIAVFAGVGFLVTGLFDIIFLIRNRFFINRSAWVIVRAVLDILIGLMFLIQPTVFLAVIPMVVGIFIAVFGIFEIIYAIRVRRIAHVIWVWLLFSGIVIIFCGVMFYLYPSSFIIYIAVLLLMRGIDLIIFGLFPDRTMLI